MVAKKNVKASKKPVSQNKLAPVSKKQEVVGSHDLSVGSYGGAQEIVQQGVDYSLLVDYMKLMSKEDNVKKMDLTEDDREFIAHLTGQKDAGSLADQFEDDDEHQEVLSWQDNLGLTVVESIARLRFRSDKEMLSFGTAKMVGKHVLNDQEKMAQFILSWLRNVKNPDWDPKKDPKSAEFLMNTLKKYAEVMLGKREGAYFLKMVKKLAKDPNEVHTMIEDLVGKPKAKLGIEEKVPGKAWLKQHHLLRSDMQGMDKEELKLKWDSKDQEMGYRLEDGRNEDEIEEERRAKNGWVFDAEGKSKYLGYMIPYLRTRRDVENEDPLLPPTSVWDVVEIQTEKGPMKVLNINICTGTKPKMEFHNLVKLAYDLKVKRTMKQEVMRRKLLNQRYRKSMQERDPSIQTCLNGKVYVYYKAYRLEDGGQEVCIFSPIPASDLGEEAKRKKAEEKAKWQAWNDKMDIQDI